MLEHGVPFRLNSRVRRLVAPNPGVMTGPGTNTYLLGNEEVAVLDPGPAIPAHIDAILGAAGDRIRWIVCTHTHPDHSPAWRAIAEATGAEVIGALPADDMFQDDTFAPTREIRHDDVLVTPEFSLRAVHTPGHVSNHFCYFMEQEQMLFAGDHIMNGSTVVIIPPSGDMKAYIESLQLLLDYPLESIAPGHGEVMGDSRAVVESVLDVFVDVLANEGRIEIRNFGVFKVKDTPARIGRNPVTKEVADVPARKIIQFKAGKTMKQIVNEGSL